jgi:hypothetical protein
MYRLSFKCLTTIVLAGVVVTTLALSSSAQRVSPVTASLNVAAMPLRARFEVTLFRFHVNQQSWDDVLERDGKGDEVSFSRVAILHSTRAPSRFLSDGLNFTQTMGENPPNGLRAGHASAARGGLKTEDDVLLPHLVLFSGELIQGETAATIIVSVWEMDGPSDLYTPYKEFLYNEESNIARIALLTLGDSPQTPLSIREWDTGFNIRSGAPTGVHDIRIVATIGGGPLGLGEVNDRPIGMVREGNRYNFVPKFLFLNFNNASRAADTNQGLGLGVIKINYKDVDELAGNYDLYVKVRRL